MALNIKKDFTGTRRKPDINTLVYGKIPPQAPELEIAVLGACLLEKDTFAIVLEIIQAAECFYVDAHQKIYASMRRLFDRGTPVDLLTVTDDLRKVDELEIVGGPHYLTFLTTSVVSSAHVEHHARIVIEKFLQRQLIVISGSVIADAYEDSTDVFDLLDKAESSLYDITDQHLRKSFKSLQQVLVQALGEVDDVRKKRDDFTGVPSGFSVIDRLTSGFQKTDLIILAARPSVGKTAFALNLALNASMHAAGPFPVALFSLEMSSGQVVRRMMSAMSEVPMTNITRGHLQEHEFMQLTQRVGRLANAKIYLDDQGALNVFELRAKARRLKQKHGVALIIIDYLQLMRGTNEKGANREQEISKISRDLKALAKELEVPIIALSQLNRSVETRKENKIPQLSDLRESGAIEQDADVVMFLYRPEYYGLTNDAAGETVEGEVQVHFAKHRNGETGMVKVKFVKEFQKFVEWEESPFAGFTYPGKPDDPRAGMESRTISFVPAGFQTRKDPINANWDDDDPTTPKKDDDAPF